MKKINIKLLVLTSALTLLPILVGLIFWEQLPDTLPSHFGFDGRADGFSSKVEAVFIIPMIMVGLHIFVVGVTSFDPKIKNVAPKMRQLVYWLIPVGSNLIQLSIYGATLGFIENITHIGLVFMGLLFLILGNYLPKIKQNYTVGIKLPWTLDNEENWNKTHRLAGKLWVVGGLILLISNFFQWVFPYVLGTVLAIMILVPCVYSYWLTRSE